MLDTWSSQCDTLGVHMKSNQVGVRELRQNFSRYLRRVAAGEWFQVTERRRPVAVLSPLTDAQSALSRLVAAGRVRPSEGDLLDLPPPKGPISTKGTGALRELREERR